MMENNMFTEERIVVNYDNIDAIQFFPETDSPILKNADIQITKQPPKICVVGKNRCCKIGINIKYDAIEELQISVCSADKKKTFPGFFSSVSVTKHEIRFILKAMKTLRSICQANYCEFPKDYKFRFCLSFGNNSRVYTRKVELGSKNAVHKFPKKKIHASEITFSDK